MMKLFSSWQGEVMLIVLLDHIPKERDRESERKRIRLLCCRDRVYSRHMLKSSVQLHLSLCVMCVTNLTGHFLSTPGCWGFHHNIHELQTDPSNHTKKCVSENHKPNSQSCTDILWKMTCITACHVLYLFDQQLFSVLLVMLSSDEWAAVLLIEHFLTPFAWSFIILSQKKVIFQFHRFKKKASILGNHRCSWHEGCFKAFYFSGDILAI